MFEFAAYAVAVGIMIYLIYRFIRDLYYEFRSAIPENGDKRVVLETKEESEETEQRQMYSKPGLGPEGRIRRKYIRLVRGSGRQKELTDSMTPMEIEEKIGGDALRDLHEAYEKARYG